MLKFGEGGSELEATVVVPTLGAPIPGGKSALWCSSFQLAWNRLKDDVVREPPVIRDAEEVTKSLNDAPHSESDLPPGSFYTAAGWAKDGIVERLRKEMSERFPSAPRPDLGGEDSVLVAYASSST